MNSVRTEIGGLGNLLFKEAFIWAQFRAGNIPDIYLQSPKYWGKYKEELRMRFSRGVGFIDKVALHIRRGDYLKATQFHRNLWETDYYKEAIALFPNEEFLVFCRDRQSEAQDKNDEEWCHENIPFLLGNRKWSYYTDTWRQEETDDLNAMASCKGLIGANSSFSFWAAFLGNPEKKVVMPKEERWFMDGASRVNLMDEWTQI